MPTPSLARQFFESIRDAAEPIAVIRSLPTAMPPTFETDWLDFKQEPQPSSLDNPKWREMWVEAIGGFANNQGGVIVWGIDARKDPATNVDAANKIKPITNPLAVKSRLKELLRQATDPPVLNVEVEAFEESTGKGYVVCFIPEGTHKPYRSEAGKRSQYYIRAGDQFIVMSRSILGTMFHPRSAPVLRTSAMIKAIDHGHGFHNVSFDLFLSNTGTATAKDVFVRLCWILPACREISFSARDGKRYQSSTLHNGLSISSFTHLRPIHIGDSRSVVRGECIILPDEAEEHKLEGMRSRQHDRHFDSPLISIWVHCENQHPQKFGIVFSIEELLLDSILELDGFEFESTDDEE